MRKLYLFTYSILVINNTVPSSSRKLEEEVCVGTTRCLFGEVTLVAPPRDDMYGGGGGIRTPARLSTPLGFQDRPLQPDLGTPPYIY
jgi:hypothetical protein